MTASLYNIPKGVCAVPDDQLDLRPDAEIDHDILHPKPITNVKNIWFYWHNGYENMPEYSRRAIRAWHCRFSKKGWVVRVVNSHPGSSLNISNFLDTKDPATFPKAFIEDKLDGQYAILSTSDLVRFPLLLKYGGVYSDVGMLQIGDLDRMWSETVGNPDSPYEIFTYNGGGVEKRCLMNYFLASNPNNPLFLRAHKLLLALWAENGGRTNTQGIHTSPLMKEIPQYFDDMSFEEDGKVYGPKEVEELLSDYLVHGEVMIMAMCIKDDEDNWDGPAYTAKHVFTMEYMVGSQLINQMTAWNGPRQFELMSLPIPKDGEIESEDQKQAREIVEACLSTSFGFKLATGLIIRVLGETLSSLWKKNEGSDNVPGTYAHWLKYGSRYWQPEQLPEGLKFTVLPPIKFGPLLRKN